MKKTKIVIAVSGFAGLYAAKYFDKSLARRADVEVMLISRENFILVHADASLTRRASTCLMKQANLTRMQSMIR